MRVYGNLMNRIGEHTTNPKPEVGMGATIFHYSDRSAATVVKVSASGKTVWLTADTATRTDNNGMSESQSYTFTPNPDGVSFKASLRKNGTWKLANNGAGVALGRRSAYHDYSF